MSLQEDYNKLLKVVEAAGTNVAVVVSGNRAKQAGTRLRKQMQDVKNIAQDIRKGVTLGRNDKATVAE